ncbi:MAG: hypothetical protein CVV13_09085 [Gammaproteobacteria bacterium HGW-Gammaproteobacteria-3]|nr:MAG: hypothetical protein CVV13_09085 [Gammaproteobacteria bacterium HGW-Gammaproteobacteria-3]
MTKNLGALSDHGKRIFSGPWSNAPAEFGSLGVELSDENGNTKGNNEARKERTFTINGTDIFSGGIANLSLTEIESTFIPIGYIMEDDYWLEYFVVILKLEIPHFFSNILTRNV